MQISLAAMLINALHAALEDAVVAFHSVRVDRASYVFIGLVADTLMAREVIAKREIMTAFIGHHCGFFRLMIGTLVPSTWNERTCLLSRSPETALLSCGRGRDA